MKKKISRDKVRACACSTLRQLTRAVSRHYETCLAPTGVTTTLYSILRYLQREGVSPLRQIADALELERTSLYRTIAPLERDGFVSVSVDPEDARVKLAHLTDAGTEKIEEILPHWQRAQDTFLDAVGRSEWNALARGLGGVKTRMADDPSMHGQLRPSTS
jgi:DNA-binding MarR family transcriptional regulator